MNMRSRLTHIWACRKALPRPRKTKRLVKGKAFEVGLRHGKNKGLARGTAGDHGLDDLVGRRATKEAVWAVSVALSVKGNVAMSSGF